MITGPVSFDNRLVCDIRSTTRVAVPKVSFNECHYLRGNASAASRPERNNASGMIVLLVPRVVVARSLELISVFSSAAPSQPESDRGSKPV